MLPVTVVQRFHFEQKYFGTWPTSKEMKILEMIYEKLVVIIWIKQ